MTHRHAPRVRQCLAAAFIAVTLVPAAAQAQFTRPPAPAAYALRNVTVVNADGTRQTGQTLVVRAGRIEALAPDAAVPPDARVLDGDSLFVYPGLVDAAGAVEFEFPRDTTNRAQVRSWDPPRQLQGFVPSRRVLDHMTADGADGADLRQQGVVAVAVHPPLNEPLMSGRGAFVLLRPDAKSAAELVLAPELAPLMSLRGSRGLYPSTMMGVMAWYRQTFLDAQRNNSIASNGNGAGPSLHFNPDLSIVQELLRSNGRVYFVANRANEIRRALALADEFGFRPVIVGGAEAWKLADELARREVPVLVSVDFEEPEQWKPDEKPAEGEQPEPLSPGAAREKEELENAYSNAARLAAAGVTFALVSGGEAELREGVMKTIEYGLSETDALRAVTTTPATLLGMPQLTRIQRNAPATFVVTDGPLFGEDTRVLYTFVEGVVENGARRGSASRGGGGGEPVNAAGTWSIEILAPETQTSTLTLTQDGADLEGTLDGPQGAVPVSGTMDGSQMTLKLTINAGGTRLDVTISGEVTGDTASGRVSTSMGDFDWRGRRTGPGSQR